MLKKIHFFGSLFFALIYLMFGLSKVFGQTDFENKTVKEKIFVNKINEIRSYIFTEESKMHKKVLVSHLSFNEKGELIKEATPDYTYNNEYNLAGLKSKTVTIRKRKKDPAITVFDYDEKGNLMSTERIKESADIEFFEPLYKKTLFTYNDGGEVLTESGVDDKGIIHLKERREYLTGLPDSGTIKTVNYYDAEHHLTNVKKLYNDGRNTSYIVDNQKQYISNEHFFDGKRRIIKIIDHRNFGPHAFDSVKKYGHGLIEIRTVTIIYNYNKFDLCSEKLTYMEGKLIEKQIWNYKQ